jgi:hypothetical protein
MKDAVCKQDGVRRTQLILATDDGYEVLSS